jgi:EpsI family protein
MQSNKQGLQLLLSSSVLIITGVLMAQTAAYYSYAKDEKVPAVRPLDQFPNQVGTWVKTQDGVVEKEVRDVLKADDLLNRFYSDQDSRIGANLFVAAFRSQRAGAAPHSPKNCLPGSGWLPIIDGRLAIDIPGMSEPIVVNRYIVQQGDAKSMVLYWYQSRDRVVAGEIEAKLYTMADAIRYNRTDTALVRVVVSLGSGDTTKQETAAISFVKTFFKPLKNYLPA